MALKRRNRVHLTAAGGCKFHFVVTADLPLTSAQHFQVLYTVCNNCTANRGGFAKRRLHDMYESGVFCCVWLLVILLCSML